VNLVPGMGSTYKFYQVGTTFNQAVDRCNAEGGYLVELTDEFENRAVVQFMQDNTDGLRDRIWIGANDMAVEGYIEWRQSKMPVTFTGWDFSGSENKRKRDCAYVDMATGMWKMRKCNFRPADGFVCERDY